MFKLEELFPVQSIGPLIGGALIWFGLNWLYIGPSVIGPRSAEKYYLPRCMTAVDSSRVWASMKISSMRQEGEERIKQTMQEAVRQFQAQAQASTGGLLDQFLRGNPEGERFRQRYGGQITDWLGGMAAPHIQAAIQQRLSREQAALQSQINEHIAQTRQGVVHQTPAAFCRCVVSEGLSDRLDLATYSASLRLYQSPTMESLANGSLINSTKSCGRIPVV